MARACRESSRVPLQRHIERSRAADPQVAFFQRRHEFAAQEREHQCSVPIVSADMTPTVTQRYCRQTRRFRR